MLSVISTLSSCVEINDTLAQEIKLQVLLFIKYFMFAYVHRWTVGVYHGSVEISRFKGQITDGTGPPPTSCQEVSQGQYNYNCHSQD